MVKIIYYLLHLNETVVLTVCDYQPITMITYRQAS